MAFSRWSTLFVTGAAVAIGLGSCTEAHTRPALMQAADGTRVEPDPMPLPDMDPVEPVAIDGDLGDAASAGAGLAGVSEGPRTYTVIGVGDIMMGSDWPQPGMDPRITPDAEPGLVMGDQLLSYFTQADIVFGNYEGTIHSSSQGAKQCGNPQYCYVFRSPPFHAEYLRRAGFTIMSNANNHARDFGEPGRRRTYDYLTQAGIVVAGGDVDGMRIGVQELDDGRRIALVAFGHNPGLLSVNNYARVAQMVREADAQADIVMVSCHIGAEGAAHHRVTRQTETYLNENRGNPYRFAHAAVDAGADIVFCHGPHIPRAVEVYNGRFIAYSLGNFWTYGRFNLRGHNGLAPVAQLQVGEDGALVSANIISALQQRPGGPFLDTGFGAARRTAELTARDMADSGTRVDAQGRVTWPGMPEPVADPAAVPEPPVDPSPDEPSL